jgi:hypothetical protein
MEGDMVDILACRQALYRFCQGKQRMYVPAREDDDDFLISAALDELELLRGQIDHVNKNWLDEHTEKIRLETRLMMMESDLEFHKTKCDECPWVDTGE